ncbi:MAG: hypothetical protein JWQ07_175 [Ramlibacter sp.]|nr:hypothetical protein [Ramlibacter sp.]
MEQFHWTPGCGYAIDALLRMQKHFSRPRTPMGEAWFMGSERKMYPELEGDLSALSCRELQRPVEEIGSGTSAFGPMDEWTDWYHYLLPRLVSRAHESYVDTLLEGLITSFFALYPEDVIDEPYRGFKADALVTLGRCMMNYDCWEGDQIKVGRILHRSNDNPNRIWCWWDASGDFSASMFFCLKYLPDELLTEWIQSVFDIRSPHWRAQLMVWLVGAHDLLSGRIAWPSDFVSGHVPSVSWAWSHSVSAGLVSVERGISGQGTFIRSFARTQLLAAARTYFTSDRFLEWLSSFDEVPYVRDELMHLPRDFEELYVR